MATNSKTPDEKKPILDEDFLSAYLEQDISELYRTVFFYLSNKEAPDITARQIVHKVIDRIKNSLDQRLVEHIELLGYCLKHYDIYHKKQCILLVGKETEIALIEGIVSYMFYVLQHSELRSLAAGKSLKWRGITLEDFSYLDEQDTEKKLFSTKCMSSEEIQRYGRGLLFFRNLNCGHERLLKRLVHVIRTNYLPGNALIFVVSTDKAENLPQEFLDLFEIIRLVPEEQSKALDTQKEKIISTFPLPPGANVSDIKMMFLDDLNVRLTIKEETRTFNYTQIGFYHEQTRKPLEAWNVLLEYAEHGGITQGKASDKKRKNIERITEKLRAIFVTNQAMFSGNQILFKICKERGKTKKPINIQSKKCPSCQETHRYYCNTCGDETEQCQGCHDELYKESHAKLNN